MNILFITRKYPPSVGGMELFAYDLSNALAAKTGIQLVKWGGTGRARAVLVALPYLFTKALLALLKGGIDVIHAQDGVLAPPVWLLAKLFGKPYTVVIHGLDMTYGSQFYQATVPRFIKRADTVFCISQGTADEAIAGGVPKDKVVVVPLAVSDMLYGTSDRGALVDEFDLQPDTSVLATVGRLVKRKGVAWFIAEVLPGLAKEYPNIIYLVAGDGEDRLNVEAAIRRVKMSEHVRLLGRVSDESRAAIYNGADIFVMPNITVPGDMEGFGLVLLEASLCELPVVAADTEGIKDAITSGKNGMLVPVEDAAAFRKEIDHFLRDKTYAREFGRKSRAYSKTTYQWSALADRYVAAYQKLLKSD